MATAERTSCRKAKVVVVSLTAVPAPGTNRLVLDYTATAWFPVRSSDMRPSAALLSALAFALPAVAQQQVVRPPIAVYWMSVDTASGMGAGMNVMSMMMGGGGGATRTLRLELGSSQSAAGEPRAGHDIPPGLNMGQALPLITPQRARETPRGEYTPESMERPKGRMKIYWGCGENVRAGQPVVIDFAGLAAGQRPPNMVSRQVSGPAGPAFGRNRTYFVQELFEHLTTPLRLPGRKPQPRPRSR